MTGRFDSDKAPDAVPERTQAHATRDRAAIETPYWIRPGGAVFEAAWATDRRDELEKLLDDVYRTAYQAGALNA